MKNVYPFFFKKLCSEYREYMKNMFFEMATLIQHEYEFYVCFGKLHSPTMRIRIQYVTVHRFLFEQIFFAIFGNIF